jgi:hypothetical protein
LQVRRLESAAQDRMAALAAAAEEERQALEHRLEEAERELAVARLAASRAAGGGGGGGGGVPATPRTSFVARKHEAGLEEAVAALQAQVRLTATTSFLSVGFWLRA